MYNRNSRVGALIEALETRRLLSANVLSWRNDAAGDGQNLSETILTPANVASSKFGQVADPSVDGQVYAQPLVLQGVNITVGNAKGKHDVVYVATENDSLYAFDAHSGRLLWHDSLLSTGATAIPATDTVAMEITPKVGITSTPLIDPATGGIYVVAASKQKEGANAHYLMKLYAVNLGSGAQMLGGPVTIADTICNNPTAKSPTYTYVSGPKVNGTGTASVGGSIFYNALISNQRPGLELVNGTIYIENASHGDLGPYHGWILGYSASTLALRAAFNATPNGSEGGIWMAGGGITFDSSGNLYVVTGNGTFDTTLTAQGFPSKHDYGESVLKLAVDSSSTPTKQNGNGWGLKVVDYFTPHDEATLNSEDKDLSTAALLLPTSVGTSADPNLLLVGNKHGTFYLLDRSKLGKFNSSSDHVVQETTLGGAWSTPTYFNGHLYFTADGTTAKEYSISHGAINATPVSHSTAVFNYPGANASLSANGAASGIIWEINNESTNTLYAYDATSYAKLLFAGKLDSSVKFAVPTVADGQVFAATQDRLYIYGLKPQANG